jgi:hypothetical protein
MERDSVPSKRKSKRGEESGTLSTPFALSLGIVGGSPYRGMSNVFKFSPLLAASIA